MDAKTKETFMGKRGLYFQSIRVAEALSNQGRGTFC